MDLRGLLVFLWPPTPPQKLTDERDNLTTALGENEAAIDDLRRKVRQPWQPRPAEEHVPPQLLRRVAGL